MDGDLRRLQKTIKARMPAIKNFSATFALLFVLGSIAVAGDYRQEDDVPQRGAAQHERFNDRRDTPANAPSRQDYREQAEADIRYADRAAKTATAEEQSPQRRPGQLPVRFEPSTHRNRGGVVQASAFEPVADESKPARLAPAKSEKTLTLSPPSDASRPQRSPGSTQSLVTLGGSLAIVVGLFLLVAWVMKRGMPKSASLLPREALEVLGRAPLAGKHQVHLLRCGNKMLLVSVTAAGVETLTEITDPVEVDRLSGLCQQSRRGSSTKAFQQVLSQFEQEPTAPTFVGDQPRTRLDLSSFESIGKNKRRGGVDG
jgi:flagellar protein FliO/FliZ